MLTAEKCIYNLTCSRRVAVRLKRIVGVHCVKSARQLVDVRLNDFAVVHRDWRVGDDVVVHWFGLVFGGLDNHDLHRSGSELDCFDQVGFGSA